MASKRIADPVHGPIELDDFEVELIQTACFQRLRSIKHLGLASLVYPAADFSRFAHSIGVCHVAGRMFNGLHSGQSGAEVAAKRRLYRSAALLHDIGHYPFSHSLERPLKRHYKIEATPKGAMPPLSQIANDGAGGEKQEGYLDHERVGSLVIRHDPEISALLVREGIDLDQLDALINGERADDPCRSIISSDLDADRLDYLPRTALVTGTPYGQIDSDFLIGQLRLDPELGRVVLGKRALRSAEHFLLARYFDRYQVAYQKSVAGIELLMERLVGKMLEDESVNLGLESQQVVAAIQEGRWPTYTDSWLMAKIDEWSKDNADDPTVALMYQTLTKRKMPKLILDNSGYIVVSSERETQADELALLRAEKAERAVKDIATSGGWDLHRFLIWNPNRSGLMTFRSSYSKQSEEGEEGLEGHDYSKWIMIQTEQQELKPIHRHPQSLLFALEKQYLWNFRVYVVDPDEEMPISDIKQTLAEVLK